MSEDWTRFEVESAIADYLDMLVLELKGENYSKTQHRRVLQQKLRNRTEGSIEFKHQNISAALVKLGRYYIPGYKPRWHYQDLLTDVLVERIAAMPAIDEVAAQVVEDPTVVAPAVADILSIVVQPPHSEPISPVAMDSDEMKPGRLVRQVNFLERESRNRSLGRAGEEFILEFEHRRLWTAGKKTLAERIDHVSVTRGDGLGYDIESFEEDGRERLIEVKTTRFGEMIPFFVSKNELAVSRDRAERYFLYRLFEFPKRPRMFMLDGDLSRSCRLDAVQYRATVE